MGGIKRMPDDELPSTWDGDAPPTVPSQAETERRIRESDARRGSTAGEDTTESAEDILTAAGFGGLQESHTTAALEHVLRRLGELARTADPLRRQVIRSAAVERLALLKVKTPTALVDAALGTVASPESAGTGTVLRLTDPEPWPEPVHGAALLDEIASVFKRYVVLPTGAEIAASLWVVHTYLINVLQVSPLLALTSPEKRCGKTTVLDILQSLCWRALGASNISAAALFRVVEHFTPTLLIDEADTFLAERDELRGIINAGYTRSTARVIRTVGDDFEPRAFSTFCPKGIAAIGGLPGTIEDRSIALRMKRRTRGEKIERLRRDRLNADLEPLRRRAARWAADNGDQIRDADPDVPPSLNDRAADIWRPLLAIADAAGGQWPTQARDVALALTDTEATADDVKGQLLADVREIFDVLHADRLTSEALVEQLCKLTTRPWGEGRRGKPLNQNGLARLLRPFDIVPKTIRLGSNTAKGYERADFNDAFSRYIPAEEGVSNRNTVTTIDSIDQSACSEPSQQQVVLRFENERKPLGDKDCDGVTVAPSGPVEQGMF